MTVKKLLRIASLFFIMIVTICSGAYASDCQPYSIISPDGVKWLGNGYNSAQRNFIYDNLALDFNNGALETDDGSITDLNFSYVSNKQELEKSLETTLNSSLSVSYGPLTAKSDLTKIIVNQTKFSSESITLIAYWRQIDKRVFSNGKPMLKADALEVLKKDPKNFFDTYGDKYVNGVTLGKMFIVFIR